MKNIFISKQCILEQDNEQLLLPSWQRLVNLMADLCDTPAGFIVQAGNGMYKVIIANESVENPYEAGVTIDADVNIFCAKVVKQDNWLYVSNATESPEWTNNPEVTEDGFNTYLGYPLHWPDGSVFGTICVMDFLKTDYDERYHRLLEHFRDMAELELDLLSKTLQFKNLALTDELTSLFNRKGFFIAAKQILKSAKRDKATVYVCYFDIDNLKPINDNFGHQVGDEIIKLFAHHLKRAFREIDVIARFGGDEFVVLLQEVKTIDIAKLIHRLRLLINSNNPEPNLSFSFGYSSMNCTNMDIKALESLIMSADREMYANKKAKKASN